MSGPADHVRVRPEDLRSVADEVIAGADEAHHDVRKLGRTHALNGAQRAFDSPRAPCSQQRNPPI
ncbi:hypothetical protein [Kibdelosporangium philippinense]|uniref:hypothetical protein n=1 Tax=Kibdelosporangium philippinense TaxID=211113 RepID=UPI00360FFB57